MILLYLFGGLGNDNKANHSTAAVLVLPVQSSAVKSSCRQ